MDRLGSTMHFLGEEKEERKKAKYKLQCGILVCLPATTLERSFKFLVLHSDVRRGVFRGGGAEETFTLGAGIWGTPHS